ncbi:MAG TPA: zf-HC2 domain-containing protein [Thermoanaerobaculia bacterium]|nr:zf-HC2 domain-containing protein [Thermoanaerobaculia bacterium]
MLTCRELIGFLSDYLAGALGPAERARFDEHLAVCPSCLAYLAQFEATVRFAREALSGEDEPPEDVPTDLIRAVLEARKQRD